jgi:hypothetical protein
MRRHFVRVGVVLFVVALATGSPAAEPDWSGVDKVFGAPGKDLPGGVRRYGWPRADLAVRVGDVKIEPALALGSWAGFLDDGGAETMTMGDLVLLDSEVTPVVTALIAGGLQITAIHNHLLNEQPHVAYVHFSGHGERVSLAKGLRAALERTKTPLEASKPSSATPEEQAVYKKLQDSLGRPGTLAGRVLQVGVPREDRITEDGMEVPPSIGMAIAMNFQSVGARVATTGDFVLVASEVNPVIRELRAGGIEVTAVHSHMLTESPRLFFMHFWGVDTPERIAGGLKAALSKVSVKP